MFKRIVSIVLILGLLLPQAGFADDPVPATTGNQAALGLMAAARSRLDEKHPIQQIKDVKDAYNKYQDILEGRITDPDLLARLQERRAEANKSFDDQIGVLRRRRDRNNFFNNAGRALERGLTPVFRATKWSLRTVGKGVRIGADTLIKVLPKSPQELLEKYLEYLTSGGALSIKDYLTRQFKDRFVRESKKLLVRETAEVLNMPELVTLIDEEGEQTPDRDSPPAEPDQPTAGYEGEGGYDDEAEDPSDEPLEPVGPEGEGGYDDEPADYALLIPGTYTCTYVIESYTAEPKTDFNDGLYYTAEQKQTMAKENAARSVEGMQPLIGTEIQDGWSDFRIYLDDETTARVYLSSQLKFDTFGTSQMENATFSGQSVSWDFESGVRHYTGNATFSADKGTVKMTGTLTAVYFDSQYNYTATKVVRFEGEKRD